MTKRDFPPIHPGEILLEEFSEANADQPIPSGPSDRGAAASH